MARRSSVGKAGGDRFADRPDRMRHTAARPRAARRSGAVRHRAFQTLGQCADERFGNERHVPGDAYDRCRRLDHCGVDPAERTEAGTNVAHGAKVGSPLRGLGRIGYQERRLSQARLSLPAPDGRGSAPRRRPPAPSASPRTGLPLRPRGWLRGLVPECPSPRFPRCLRCPAHQYRLPLRRSRTTSNPIVMLKRCLYVNSWGGTRSD